MSFASNVFSGVGTIGTEPELRFTPSGTAVCAFSLAFNVRERQQDGSYKDGTPRWVKVTSWKDQAELIAEGDWKKGTRVFVQGEISVQEFEGRDGSKRVADEIKFPDIIALDTRFAIVTARKPDQKNSNTNTRNTGNSRPAQNTGTSFVAGSSNFDEEPPW